MDDVKGIWYAVKTAFYLTRLVATKLKWLLFNALAFPTTVLWFRIPLWILWFILLTKPKQVKEWGDKAFEWLSTGAGKIHSFIWSSPLMGVLILIFASPIPIAAFILKAFPPKLSRIVITVGLCNFLVSDVLLDTPFSETAKKYFGWEMPPDFMLANLKIMWVVSALAAILLFFIWWLTREETDKAKARSLRREHGWIKGSFILVWEDIFGNWGSSPTEWVCEECGYENPIEEGEEPGVVCDDCGTRNPGAKWKCQKQGCRTVNKAGTKRCSKCGTPNPHLRDEEDDEDLDVCPNCDHEQEAGYDICEECGYEFDDLEPPPPDPADPPPDPHENPPILDID